MFDWLKNKTYPDFWNEYVHHFKDKKEQELNTSRFVVFDTETTGLHIKEDKMLSIGAVSMTGNVIDVADSFEIYIKQESFNTQTVAIHGILKEGSMVKTEEKEAVVLFLQYIKDAILVAHHAAFDMAMINESLARLGLPKLKNKVLDTGILFKKTALCKDQNKQYALDVLCEVFHIKKHDRHTAAGDAFITGLIFLKIVGTLMASRKLTLKDLLYNRNRRGLL